MGEFVADDACQFFVVQAVADASGHGYGVCLLVDARGVGVQLRVVYDVNLWHIHAACDAQVLHYVVYARIFASGQRACARSVLDNAGVEDVGEGEPRTYTYYNIWHGRQPVLVDVVCVEGGHRVAHLVVADGLKSCGQGKEDPYHAQDDARKRQEQQYTVPVVPVYLGLYADVVQFE